MKQVIRNTPIEDLYTQNFFNATSTASQKEAEKAFLLSTFTEKWVPMINFSYVPEMLMYTIKHLSQFINFNVPQPDPLNEIYFSTEDICEPVYFQEGAIFEKVYVKSKKRILHKCSLKEELFQTCSPQSNNSPYQCMFGHLSFPTGMCPVMLAAYFRYLALTDPEEIERQREQYRTEKDLMDSTLVDGFEYYNPYKTEILPLLTSQRVKEVRDLIDHGNIVMFQGKFPVLKLYDTSENETKYKGFENYYGATFEKSENEMLKQFLRASINMVPSYTKSNEEEAVFQILFLLRLLNDGNYSEYIERIKEKEASIKKLQGNYFRGYIAGNDKEEVEKLLKDKEFQIRYSYNIPRISGSKYDAICFATELSGRKSLDELTGKTNDIRTDKLYILDNLKYFCDIFTKSKEDPNKHYVFQKAIEAIADLSVNSYILLLGTKKEIDEFLRLDSRLESLFNDNATIIEDHGVDEILEQYFTAIESQFPEAAKAAENKTVLKKFLTQNYASIPIKNRELINYLISNTDPDGNINFAAPLLNTQNKDFDTEINKLTGLTDIKNQLHDFYNLVSFRRVAESSGLDIEKSNMHMIFDGPPGSGKTTVARLIAKALYDIGITKSNKIVECERKDLIAEYVGQTAVKTFDKVQEARGGVLFIDEAYSLAGANKDFGFEAIATLIKAMEDYKDDLVVIFAGYTKEMQEFTESNSGIKSRVGYNFHFASYSAEELAEMLINKLKSSGFSFETDFKDEFIKMFSPYLNDENFGNGRFVMKIYQMIIQNIANRYAEDPSSELKTVLKKDIPSKNDILKITPAQKVSLGFI